MEAILHQFQFDLLEQASKKEWGALTSLRIEYANGIEAEFGIADEEWVQEPLEQMMIEAVLKGFKVIWERESDLFRPITTFVDSQKV
ncbi:hypothetical protein D3C78_1699820 [compost metagenome]